MTGHYIPKNHSDSFETPLGFVRAAQATYCSLFCSLPSIGSLISSSLSRNVARTGLRRSSIAAGLLLVLAAMYAGNASAQGSSNPISVDFVGTATAMANTETAGVVPETNWNDASGASSSAPLALVDSGGNSTGVSITWQSDDVWESSITDSPGNVRMMKGYLDNGNEDTTTVAVSGLSGSANGYTVYAQGDSNGTTSKTGIYQISGTGITTTSISLICNSSFNGTFTQGNNSAGNYVTFTIPNVPGFTLSAIPSIASDGYERAPVNGIQIVPIASTDPSFTLTSTPSAASVTAGSNATYTATAAAQNGFSGTVNLSASGLPSGATASFNPAAISTSGSSTLTIATGTSTPAGTSTLTITGTSGSETQTARSRSRSRRPVVAEAGAQRQTRST